MPNDNFMMLEAAQAVFMMSIFPGKNDRRLLDEIAHALLGRYLGRLLTLTKGANRRYLPTR